MGSTLNVFFYIIIVYNIIFNKIRAYRVDLYIYILSKSVYCYNLYPKKLIMFDV